MKDDFKGSMWRLGVFGLVCLAGLFALFTIFSQLRFESERTYDAMFTNVSGLKKGNFVRIAGVEVGKVKDIVIQPDATVRVSFATDDSVVLTQGSRAAIRYDDLIGGRYLTLEEGTGGMTRLRPGDTIPLSNTAPALDLDALIGGFRPLFKALDPTRINALTGQLISALQGQGATVGSFLTQTATLTNTLADRDELVGEVINNLNAVLGSLGDQSKQFDKGVSALTGLVHGLAQHKTDLSNSVAYGNAAAASIADLLGQSRPPLKKVVNQLDRTAGAVMAEHDYFDNLLDTLPDAYQALLRQGIYGDFFSFYMCDLLLKVNGKGGEPVYIKVAGQSTGRCTPR